MICSHIQEVVRGDKDGSGGVVALLGRGRVVVGPASPFATRVLKRLRAPFDEMRSHVTFLRRLKQSLRRVCFVSSVEYNLEKVKTILEERRWLFSTLEAAMAVDLNLVEEDLQQITSLCQLLHSNTKSLEDILDGILTWFSCFDLDKFVLADSEEDFQEKSQNLLANNQFIAGIYFPEEEENPDFKKSPKMKYILKMNFTQQINEIHVWDRLLTPPAWHHSTTFTPPENSPHLQTITDAAILDDVIAAGRRERHVGAANQTNTTLNSPFRRVQNRIKRGDQTRFKRDSGILTPFEDVYAQPISFACHLQQRGFYEDAVTSSTLCVCLVGSLFAAFVALVTLVFADDKGAADEELKSGHSSQLWSNFCSLMLCSVSLLVLLVTLLLTLSSIFTRTEVILMFGLLFFFGLNLIVISYMVTSALKRKFWCVFCTEVLLALFGTPFACLVASSGTPSRTTLILTCLFPTSCASLGLQSLLQFELLGVGASTPLVGVLPTQGDGLSLSMILAMLLFDLMILSLGSVIQMIIRINGWKMVVACKGTYLRVKGGGAKLTRTPSEERRIFNIFNEPESNIHRTLSGGQMKTVKAVALQKLFLNQGRPVIVGENLSFEIFQNQVFVFYGASKSGKTTILSMIAGLIQPSSGYVTVYGDHGRSVGEDGVDRKKSVSFCPSSISGNEFMSVAEALFYFSRLNGTLGATEARHSVGILLEDFELEIWKDVLISQLSKSFQKRVAIATAFAGDPKVILLDEPLRGVDKATFRPVWKVISKWKREKTIIISTKETEEIEYLADVVALLDKGKLLYSGSVPSLLDEFSPGYTVDIYSRRRERGRGAEHTFNLETRIDALRSRLSEHFPDAFLKGFEGDGDVKFHIPYSEAQEDPHKFCVLFRDLEMRSDDLGMSHVRVGHPALTSVLQTVIHNCGTGTLPPNRAGILFQKGFQGSHFLNLGSCEESHDPKFHLNISRTLLKKRFLHNYRQIQFYLKSFVIPVLLFVAAMLTLWLVATPDTTKEAGATRFVSDESVAHSLFAFPKETYHRYADFHHQLDLLLLGTANQDPNPTTLNKCDAATVKKNFVYKRKNDCTSSEQNVDFSDCICSSENCVLKMVIGSHKLVIPFHKRHFKILPLAHTLALLSPQRSNAVLFHDFRDPSSLLKMKNLLSTARMRVLLASENPSNSYTDLYLQVQLQPLTSVHEDLGHYGVMYHLVVLFSSILLLFGITQGVVTTSVQVIEERGRGESRLVSVAGVPKWLSWSSFIVWDALVVLLCVFALTSVAAMFSDAHLVGRGHLTSLTILSLLYGWVAQVMTYLVAGWSVGASPPRGILIAGSLLVAFLSSLIIIFVQEFRHLQIIRSLQDLLRVLLYFLPPHVYVSGLKSIGNHDRENWTDGDEGPRIVSSFKWSREVIENDPIGTHYLALVLWIVFGYAFLAFLESSEGLRNRFRSQTRRKNSKDEPINQETYRDSKLSLLICGLQFKAESDVGSNTIQLDVYACRGECLTIVGLNTAQKGCLLRYLTGEVKSSPGAMQLVDEEGTQTPYDVRISPVGFCPRVPALDPHLSTEEEIQTAVELRGMSGNVAQVVARALSAFDLSDVRERKVGHLPEGARKRIGLAKALIGDPQLVILEDPNENSCLSTRKMTSDLISSLKAGKRTVVVLSENLEEAEAVSDRLAVVENGRVVYIGKMGLHEPSMQGRYLVKITAEKSEDIPSITKIIRQEVQEFTIIEKYNTNVIADTASEVTPYSIFGAVSKARKIASFWYEISSMSLPQYYQRLGLHPTRNSSYSSTDESLRNEVPSILFPDDDSGSTLTLPVFDKCNRESFYDNLEEDITQEKFLEHRRTLSYRARRSSGSNKLTPCSTPQPPRTPIDGNPSGSSVESMSLAPANDRLFDERTRATTQHPKLGARRNVPPSLRLSIDEDDTLDKQSKGNKVQENKSSEDLRGDKLKNRDLIERFIENLPKVAPRASIECLEDDVSEAFTQDSDSETSSSSEDRTEF